MPVSIAGLWSALAAADHFENVLIVEPEVWVGTELGTRNWYNVHGERVQEKTPPRNRVVQYANSIHGEYIISRVEKNIKFMHYQLSSL